MNGREDRRVYRARGMEERSAIMTSA